ncbi:MAG: PIN domain-containing protein [Aquificae bacterium]|nr:PIN domain-containing protein [Aquificota bacterium]
MVIEMGKRVLVDTNLWLYTLGIDVDLAKRERMIAVLEKIIEEGWEIFICSQVCKEFVRVGIEKYGYDREFITEQLEKIKTIANILYEDCEDLTTALELREIYNLQFWDSVIIATALNNKISYILTEDVSYPIIKFMDKEVELINPFDLT